MPEQLQFFGSLDFPGRTTLMLWEIAARLGCTVRHLLNEVDSGTLTGLDIAATSSREAVREARALFVVRLSRSCRDAPG